MDPFTLIQTLALLLGFYMAWNIGANDVANAMGTSVGSRALSLRHAVILAAILEFSGAFFVGSSVSQTIQKGIIDTSLFQADPWTFVLGMMGSLLATGLLLQAASYFGLPLSTTHAIVGSVVGFGLCVAGIHAIHWQELAWIASSWILSPLLSGLVAYAIFSIIQKKILFTLNPIEAATKLTPALVFLCFSVVTLSLVFHGLHLDLSFTHAISLSSCVGLSAASVSHLLVKRKYQATPQLALGLQLHQAISLEKALYHLQRVHLSNQAGAHAQEISQILHQMHQLNDTVRKSSPLLQSATPYHSVEQIFIPLQILSACLVAFAHGANDVANAIGPVAAIVGVFQTHAIPTHSPIPSWLLALGGSGIVIGLATWGWRVIETVGKRITELTPTRGFSAEFGAALTILLASKLGLPISTTHALIGAVLGVGLAGGIKALNLQTLKEIVISWAVTIPLCALVSILAFHALKLCIKM